MSGVIDDINKKKCIRCGVVKGKKRSFWKNSSVKDGYSNICKYCMKKKLKREKVKLEKAIVRVSGKGNDVFKVTNKKNKWVEVVVNSIGGWLSEKSRNIVYDYYCLKFDEIIKWLGNNSKDGLVYLLGVSELGLNSRKDFFGNKDWKEIDNDMERLLIVSLEEYMEDLLCKMIVKDKVDRDIKRIVNRMNSKIGSSGF